eukprot:scaffold13393_cov19-Tisochrysis_lutea.AAC.1
MSRSGDERGSLHKVVHFVVGARLMLRRNIITAGWSFRHCSTRASIGVQKHKGAAIGRTASDFKGGAGGTQLKCTQYALSRHGGCTLCRGFQWILSPEGSFTRFCRKRGNKSANLFVIIMKKKGGVKN